MLGRACLLGCLMLLSNGAVVAASCGDSGVALQVLGSGGPEITDERASSGYLVWSEGHARVLIDLGAGSLLRFESSGARIEDLEAILLTHLHADHSNDLPALIKGSYFTDRARDLPLFGPTGNGYMPATEAFVAALLSAPDGAYRYLSDYLTGSESYRLVVTDVEAQRDDVTTVVDDAQLKLSAIGVHHGPIPALAWRIDIAGKSIVISGDMNGDRHNLETLARNADLLVAHHAIPEGARGAARNLHMPPSVIGQIAAAAQVRQVVLSHRMRRTLGKEAASERIIRRFWNSPLEFAEDGQCFSP